MSPRFSTPLYPQGNELAERNVQNFKNCLHHIVIKFDKAWVSQLPFLLWALNEMPSSTTKVSPMEMLTGRQGRGPLSLVKNVWSGSVESSNAPKRVSDYLSDLRDRLTAISSIAASNASHSQLIYI